MIRFSPLMILLACGDKPIPLDRPGPDLELSISPANPTTVDDLLVDADPVSPVGKVEVELVWWKNGEATEHMDNLLSAEHTTKGDVWTVQALATDANGLGEVAVSEETLILNSGPTQPTVRVLPSAPTVGLQSMQCVIDDASVDGDADVLSYSFTWMKEGEPYTDADTQDIDGDLIDVSALVEGDHWQCGLVVSDGESETEQATADAVVAGAYEGFGDTPLSLSTADRVFFGVGHRDYMGHAVAGAGDIDGDGIDELMVSAHRMERDGRNRGATFIFRGVDLQDGDSTDPIEDAAWIIDASHDFDFSGYALAGAGDVDGDGLDDVLVSSHNADDVAFNSGVVGLFTGATLGEPRELWTDDNSVRFVGESLRAYTGFAVDSAGDVDGDGRPDVLIGAMGNLDRYPYEGKAYVVRADEFVGDDEVMLGVTGTTLWGEERRGYAGWSVSAAGDADGDGLDDVLVSACGMELDGTEQGKVYLVLADMMDGVDSIELSDVDTTWSGESDFAWGGYDVEGLGDIDGDGRPEFAMSALLEAGFQQYPGRVYVFRGGPMPNRQLMSNAPLQFVPDGDSDQFGREISGDGDVDGDGLSDLLVGAMTASQPDSGSGAAYLWLGASLVADGIYDARNADARFSGNGPGDLMGGGLSIAQDLDGDALDDIAIGAHGTQIDGDEVGSVGIWFSR